MKRDYADNKRYNYLGRIITSEFPLLSDSSYGMVDGSGRIIIKWGEEDDICDKDGFDKRYRPTEGSSEYVCRDFILPRGTKICRYGSAWGRFTAPAGTEYEKLGLPYLKDSIEYHEYLVSGDLKVKCVVTKGLVAPKFDSDGGAIQYMHGQNIALECEDGYLQEVQLWRV